MSAAAAAPPSGSALSSAALRILAGPLPTAIAPGQFSSPAAQDALRRIDAALVFCSPDSVPGNQQAPDLTDPANATAAHGAAPPAEHPAPDRTDITSYLYGGGCWSAGGQPPEAAAYPIIDGAGRLRTSLEIARKDLSDDEAHRPTVRPGFEPLERLLSSLLERVYFMEGIARVGVAHSMAVAGQTQYCFQAMEAATDDLGRAAAESERFSGTAAWLPVVMPWSELQSIHARVFKTWEAARTVDDTSAIRRLTMGGLLQQAEEGAAANPVNRAWTSRHVFAWLSP